MQAEWVSAISACIATIVGIIAAIVALCQLGGMKKSLKAASLGNVLSLEAEMNGRKVKVEETSAKIRKAELDKSSDEFIEILGDELNGYIESWLNAADRLAFCILKGYWSERDWKTEYRDYIASLVTAHEEKFGASTAFTNILDINNKWKRY